jgi:hypothetical protein
MPGPGRPRFRAPLAGIGIRYITIAGRRYASQPRPNAKARPSIQWASCNPAVKKPERTKEPDYVAQNPATTFAQLVLATFTDFNNPCD